MKMQNGMNQWSAMRSLPRIAQRTKTGDILPSTIINRAALRPSPCVPEDVLTIRLLPPIGFRRVSAAARRGTWFLAWITAFSAGAQAWMAVPTAIPVAGLLPAVFRTGRWRTVRRGAARRCERADVRARGEDPARGCVAVPGGHRGRIWYRQADAFWFSRRIPRSGANISRTMARTAEVLGLRPESRLVHATDHSRQHNGRQPARGKMHQCSTLTRKGPSTKRGIWSPGLTSTAPSWCRRVCSSGPESPLFGCSADELPTAPRY